MAPRDSMIVCTGVLVNSLVYWFTDIRLVYKRTGVLLGFTIVTKLPQIRFASPYEYSTLFRPFRVKQNLLDLQHTS